MGAVRALQAAIYELVHEKYAYGKEPAGLRLEIHPTTRYLIFRDPDALASFTGTDEPELEIMAELFSVPEVKLNPELQPDGWRLAVVTEQVLLGGRL